MKQATLCILLMLSCAAHAAAAPKGTTSAEEGASAADGSSPDDAGAGEILRTGIVGIDRVYHLTPLMGVGWSSESGSDESALYYTVGFALEFRPSLNHAVLFSLSTNFYRRTYIEDRFDPALGGLGRTTVDERKWNAEGLYAYDLLESVDPDRRVAGELLGGLVLRSFDNSAHPQTLLAASVGFRFSFAVSRYLDVTTQLLYGYNFVPPSSSFTSFNGEPRSIVAYAGALGFRFPPHSRVRLGYSGESVPLGRTYRHYHGVNLAYDIGF